MKLIAVPSEAPGGLEAEVSEHFGHCGAFTLVEVEEDKIGEVRVLANEGHVQGGCMAPVMLLKQQGVDVLVAGGMGMRPLAGFQQVGISVYSKEDAATVGRAIEMFIAGDCHEFGDDHTCGGHEGGSCGGHGHSHGHHQHELKLVERPVEDGLVAHIKYRLFDEAEEEPLTDAETRYLHGQGQIAPGLERAVAGHAAGDSFEVTLTPEDGYGERKEDQQIEVPAAQLPEDAEPGQTLQMQTQQGIFHARIVSIEDGTATLDTNHPLAGRTLRFEVNLLGVYSLSTD